MALYNHLPGVQIQTIDGGLAVNQSPLTKSLLIVGTSAKGDADTPVQVVDADASIAAFGLKGTLVQGLEEARPYCDNIFLMRVGTSPAQLSGVGASTSYPDGIDIIFDKKREEDTSFRYRVWYMSGVLLVFYDNTLIYSNDTVAGTTRDDNFVLVSGVATAGLPVVKSVAGTGTIDTTSTSAVFSTANTLAVGDYILAATGEFRKVTVVTDSTHVTLQSAFGSDLDDGTFKIIKAATLKTVDGALTLAEAHALATAGSNTKPVLTAADTGVNMTLRELYIAQQKALDLLDTFPVQGVFSPGCYLDAPNVAFYKSGDATTAKHNPATNPDALDWLKTTTDELGNKTFHWASETVDSTGASVSAETFTNRTDRKDKGYAEVNFGYQLARFAAAQEENLGGCLAFIGTSGPLGYQLPDIRNWVGALPTVDSSNVILASGKGLLGIPYMVGCAGSTLNPLTTDYLTGRSKGFFRTGSGEYDGTAEIDRNQYPVDIGAYLHVVADYALISTGAGRYVGNIAGIVAGLVQAMDEKSSPTNKPLRRVTQLYRLNGAPLDKLTYANINMLRFKRVNEPPYVLHGMTAATDISDWTNVLRMRSKFLVVQQIFEEGDRFVGESTADGMQLQAMQTAIDARLTSLQKRGYIQRYRFSIRSTEADMRVGRAFIDVSFMPPDELVQLRATVSISRQ